MVWGLILQPRIRYSQHVSIPHEITGAALDITHADDQPVKVMLNFNDTTFLLCTLQRNLIQQAPLNVKLTKGYDIKLFIVGKSPVHLIGNVLLERSKKEEVYIYEQLSSDRHHFRRDPLKKRLTQPQDYKNELYTSSSDEDEDSFIEKNKDMLDKIIKRITQPKSNRISCI